MRTLIYSVKQVNKCTMSMNRVKHPLLKGKIITAQEAVTFIKDKMTVATSGFTKAGDSKAVLPELARYAKENPLKISLLSGASLGHGTDGALAESHVLALRLPFQVDPVLRKAINNNEISFIDQHLGETAELIKNDHFPKIDIAIIEATQINEDGSIIPTTSVGNSPTFLFLAKKIIVEINTSMPETLTGIHDIFLTGWAPNRPIIPITSSDTRIGHSAIHVDPEKIAGIVFTDVPDSPADVASPDIHTTAIAGHIIDFFDYEVKKGRLSERLLPLQAGIGKVANAVLHGFVDSNFHDITMYSEVLQDSTFDLLDSGRMNFASASSITVSKGYYDRILNNIEDYKKKLVLRPQNISNSAEVIRRLGVIAINTAIECDIYGNVNSTHIGGTHIMNGIGGSGDFARNAYLSIFVTQSTTKSDTVSRILPMVSHTDHTEHDVDIIVTERGLADLRGLTPHQRAKVVIQHCAHPDYQDALSSYFERAVHRGGHTPHLLEEAFSWHTRLRTTGSMKI